MKPKMLKGWRCFHCDKVFTDEDSARLHFGSSEVQEPLCLVTAERYREVERQLAEYRNESDATARTFFENGAKAQRMATDAEQKGYDRGISDAKAHPEELDLIDQRTVRVEIESRIHAIVAEHGDYEPDTNVTNLPEVQEAICEELESLLGALIPKEKGS